MRINVGGIEIWFDGEEPRCRPNSVESAIPIVRSNAQLGSQESGDFAKDWLRAAVAYQDLHRKRSRQEETRIGKLMRASNLDRAAALKFMSEDLGL